MAIYIICLLGSLGLARIAERYEEEDGEIQQNRFALVILIAFLVFISGFRYMNYYASDEWNYRVMADSYKGVTLSLSTIFSSWEWGFTLIEWVSVNIFGGNQALIFIAALITNTLVVLFLYKYNYSFTFSIFLYIASGAYFTSMNVMRQYLAMSIVLWCYPLAKEKKLLKYVVLALLASFIHQSALVMIPLYFVFRSNGRKTYSYMIIAAMIVVLLNFDTIVSWVLSFTSYNNYVEDYLSSGYGVSTIRILAWIIPYILIIARQNVLTEGHGMDMNIIYTTVLSACILILSSRYVYVARFDSYFSIVTYTGISMIPLLFTEETQRAIRICMVVLFFIFGAYQAYINPVYHNILLENIGGTL